MGLVLLQSHARRKQASKELKRLRTEAKSMDHLKKLNKGLENKIIELQQRITEQVCLLGRVRRDLIYRRFGHGHRLFTFSPLDVQV